MEQKVTNERVVLFDLLKANAFYKIPNYQRKYVWNDENIENILEDFLLLLKNKKETLYIGNIILKYTSNGDIYIIDGQQRITTIILLLRVLKDMYSSRFGKHYDDPFIINIDNFIFYETFSEKNQKLIIKDLINQKSFDKVVEDNEFRKFSDLTKQWQDVSIYHKNYYLIYKNFYEKFNNLNDKNYKNKLDEILDILKRIWIVNIKLTNHDDELKIFETLNSRGTPLSVIDLIKNLYFIIIEQIALQKETNYSIIEKEELEESILTLFNETLIKTIASWRNLSPKNQSQEIEIEFTKLIKEFIIYKAIKLNKNMNLPNEKNQAKLYNDFKELITENNKLKNYNDVKESLKELERFLALKDWIKTFKHLEETTYEDYELSLMLLNDLFSGNQFIPIIIQLLDKYANISKKTFEVLSIEKEFGDAILYLEKLIIKRNFVGQGSRLMTRTINKIKINEFKDLKKEFENKYRLMPNQSEFSDGLMKKNIYKVVSGPILKTFLWKIELSNNKINSNETINSLTTKNKQQISIEHILPQNINSSLEWQQALINEKNKIWEFKHQELVNNLGNLTLSLDNNKMQNYSFKIKRKYYLQSTLESNKLIGRKTLWGEKEIIERTKEITQRALKLWN